MTARPSGEMFEVTSCTCCGKRDNDEAHFPPLVRRPKGGSWRQWPLALLVFVGVLELRKDCSKGGAHELHFYWAHWATLLVSLLDEADLLLDIGVVFTLFDRGEVRYGSMLLVSVIVAQMVIWFSKWSRNWVGVSEARLIYFAIFELQVFVIEDGTTLLAFTQVDGLYNSASWFDVANLVTTLLSAIVTGGLLAKESAELGLDWKSGSIIVPLLVGLVWNCYLAIGVVALEQPQSDALDRAVVVIHGIAWGGAMLCSLVVVWTVFRDYI